MSEDTEERFEADEESRVEAEIFCAALGEAQNVVRDSVDFSKVVDERGLKAIAACSGMSEVGVMPGCVLVSSITSRPALSS